jgi:hypothetical protein
MKNLFELINESKNITVNERHDIENDPKPEDVIGKDAEKNKTGGRWAIDEPMDNEPMEELTKEDMNRNIKRLLMKFDAEEPFFIIGEAGWAKTSIIKNMAKRFKRRVITVYLDKALKEDLGGQPIPTKDKDDDAVVETAMPGWAAYMKNHPDEKFLLFFDEMNQADPGVMNALMPIVLETEICGYKFDNFMVGAAGNFDYENDVNPLSGPLESRFKPIMVWETNTEDTWDYLSDYYYLYEYDECGIMCINVGYDSYDTYNVEYRFGKAGDLFDEYSPLDQESTLAAYCNNKQFDVFLKEFVLDVNRYFGGSDSDFSFSW